MSEPIAKTKLTVRVIVTPKEAGHVIRNGLADFFYAIEDGQIIPDYGPTVEAELVDE